MMPPLQESEREVGWKTIQEAAREACWEARREARRKSVRETACEIACETVYCNLRQSTATLNRELSPS